MNGIREKIRKFNLLHFFIFTITITLSVIAILDSYSKYVTSISGDTDMEIARWKILVNNQDVTQSNSLTNVITPVFPGNSNIASNVIAPTAEGYIEISIDASDTDVSFRYIITASPNSESDVTDFVVSGYEIDGGARQDVSPQSTFSLDNTILYTDLDKTVDLKIYLKWNDDSQNGATMDNDDDTIITTTTSSLAKINVNLRFVQIPTSGTTTTTTTESTTSTTTTTTG